MIVYTHFKENSIGAMDIPYRTIGYIVSMAQYVILMQQINKRIAFMSGFCSLFDWLLLKINMSGLHASKQDNKNLLV